MRGARPNCGRNKASPGMGDKKTEGLCHYSTNLLCLCIDCEVCQMARRSSLTRSPSGWYKCDDPHGHTTPSADKCRPGLKVRQREFYLKQQLNQLANFSGITVQKSIVPGTTKSLGQSVLKHPPKQILAFTALRFQGIGFAVSVAKSHLCTIIVDDVVLTDHPPVQMYFKADRPLPTCLQCTTHCLGRFLGR